MFCDQSVHETTKKTTIAAWLLPPAPKTVLQAQMLAAREQAIIDAVNRLLAEKGF